jgi:hypothetical protein
LLTNGRADRLAHSEPLGEDRNPQRDGAEARPTFSGILISEVESESVSWLWRGWLALGKISVMDGDPGLGKSAAVLDLAARVSTGSPFPDGTKCGNGAGGVVVLSAEDGLADTIKPRLEAAGADTSRISSLKTVVTGTGESRQERPFALPKDLPLLEREIDLLGATLVIVDPLMAFFGGGIDAHKDQDVRRALTPLAALAERTGAAVQLVRHLNKGEGKSPVYRGGGSIGIIGAARMGALVAADPRDENRRVLAPTKNNLATRPKSLSYGLEEAENGAVRVVWSGESDLSAADLLGALGESEPGARGEAEDFLRSMLADGPLPSDEIFGAAKDARISNSTLRRAKDRLGVGAVRENVPGGKRGSGKWVWRLPETTSLAGGVQGGHAAEPRRLERPQDGNAAEHPIGTPVLQDAHPNGETGPSADNEHLEGDKRRTRPLTENEILGALNRRGSPAFEQAELYRGGRLAKEEAVEAVARTILKDNGSDDADWRASAPAVEAVLAHPLDCFCEQCW